MADWGGGGVAVRQDGHQARCHCSRWSIKAVLVAAKLHIFDETSGQIPVMFVATEPGKPECEFSLIITEFLNLTRPEA